MVAGDSQEIPKCEFDVVVVGGGIAGLCAALTAREAGATVILAEKSPREERGGNTRFADAQIRFPHAADEFVSRSYSEEEMIDDLMRISHGRANRALVETLVRNAADTVEWLTAHGVEWEPGYPHTAGYRRAPQQGGQGLVDTLFRRLEGADGVCSYESGAMRLLLDSRRQVTGVRCTSRDGLVDLMARGGVVLACGGFQANVQMRVAHLGRFADSLILRGSRFNTGDGIRMALEIGAQPAGQWGDYHAAVIDARSPAVECGVTALYNFQMGIIVNKRGERFLDEGEDFRDHTYVTFGTAMNGGCSSGIAQFDLGGWMPCVLFPSSRSRSNLPGCTAWLNAPTVCASFSAGMASARASSRMVAASIGGPTGRQARPNSSRCAICWSKMQKALPSACSMIALPNLT